MNECLRIKLKGSGGFQLLTLLILVGSVASETSSTLLPPNHKDPIDAVSSKDLKLEARTTDDIPEQLEETKIQANLPKVYPVYPESRSTLENNLSIDSPTSWKVVKPSAKDSYLNALNHSHLNKFSKDNKIPIQKPKITKLIRRNYDSPVYRGPTFDSSNDLSSASPRISLKSNDYFQTPSDSYSLPVQQASSFNEQNEYGTLEGNYGPPQINYGASANNYEALSQSYGPPAMINTGYGPPKQSYGPPAQLYGPPAQPQQAYGAASWTGYQLPSLPSIDFAWPLAIKMNALTIAKIILKLVIFKMIVKFIAAMCLLLFIPKLESKKGDKDNDDNDDDDNGRRLMSSDSTTGLNLLTARVLESIEKYGLIGGTVDNKEENCSSYSCRFKRIIGTNDTWTDYIQLFNSYAAEEETNQNNGNPLETKT